MHFYKPMLAKPISKSFSSNDWVFEVKWDGFRAIAYMKDNLFTLQSRNGNELKRNFPEIEEITQLTTSSSFDW
jgi:bifunctional non-homologous end joining protein LigD